MSIFVHARFYITFIYSFIYLLDPLETLDFTSGFGFF